MAETVSSKELATVPLYLQLADELARLIEGGQLQPLERVPSVRRLALQRGVSLTTAVAALRTLEQRGLIEARPQSGFFVAQRAPRLAEPTAPRLPHRARLVGMQALLERLREASADPNVVRLGQALPAAELFPERQLRRELNRAARRTRLITSYETRAAGTPALRHEIARRYAQIGAAVPEDELVITNGCMEALNLALRAVAGPGDTIAVESPTYFGLLQVAESLGLKVVEVPVHPRHGLDVEALSELLGSRAGRDIRACVTITSFSNPSGALMPEGRRRELVRLCRSADIALVEDDIYGDLQHAGARPLPAKTWDRDGRVLLCSSFSKSLAPGARIGFVAGGRWSEQIRAARFVASVATAPLQQEMLAGFLRSGGYERHLLSLRRALATQVAQVSRLVEESFPADTRLTRPRGGFVLWVELPGGVDTLALYDEARQAGVDFVPGALFSASGRYGNCLRLNCGYPVTPAIESAVRRLGGLVSTRV